MAKTVRPRATTARKKKPAAAQIVAENEAPLPSQEPAIQAAEHSPEQNEAPNPVAPEELVENALQTVSSYPVEALYFDATWYLAAYPDVGACGIDAVEHFMTHGYLEGRDPNGSFSVSEYIAANPDIPLTINPFLHFIMHGAAEGRPLRR
ncbi:hypothetical protein ABHV46_00620 [Asaia sp. BMEF1]|uniref:hypothetical protein n=1 Tax=unclassified Asaia TaxID=2685023 RepID=UPI003019C5E9